MGAPGVGTPGPLWASEPCPLGHVIISYSAMFALTMILTNDMQDSTPSSADQPSMLSGRVSALVHAYEDVCKRLMDVWAKEMCGESGPGEMHHAEAMHRHHYERLIPVERMARWLQINEQNNTAMGIGQELCSAWAIPVRRAQHEVFRLPELRPYQIEAINEVMSCRDAVVNQQTGSGKSICFMLPAAVRTGVTLVLAPTLSLITDQVARSQTSLGSSVVGDMSSNASGKAQSSTLRDLCSINRKIKLVYTPPEKLSSESTSCKASSTLAILWDLALRIPILQIPDPTHLNPNSHCVGILVGP